MKTTDAAVICKALGDTNRLQILQLLFNGEMCACDLLEHFDLSQPTLSYHMKILTDCALVDSKKSGKMNHYTINCKTLNKYKRFIEGLDCSKTKTDTSCACRTEKQ